MSKPLTARFWAKVQKGDGGTQCWLWQGYRDKDGYGRLWGGSDNPTQVTAHRVSFSMHKGDVPRGAVVMHICDNPGCVNHAHLRVGSTQDNVDDKVSKTRHAFGERSGQAKLTESDVCRIRAEGHISASAFARALGVSKPTVLDARNGVTWRHVA